jgi:hypothetical protein
MGLRLLKIAAWVVFAGDLLVVIVFLGAGAAASSSLEREMTLIPAAIAALALAVLFAITFFSARRGSRVGLWIGLVLGGVPLVLLVEMIGEQHGLWPRM